MSISSTNLARAVDRLGDLEPPDAADVFERLVASASKPRSGDDFLELCNNHTMMFPTTCISYCDYLTRPIGISSRGSKLTEFESIQTAGMESPTKSIRRLKMMMAAEGKFEGIKCTWAA